MITPTDLFFDDISDTNRKRWRVTLKSNRLRLIALVSQAKDSKLENYWVVPIGGRAQYCFDRKSVIECIMKAT